MAARFTRPYVDALFAVADDRGAEETLAPLRSVAGAIAASEELRGVFRNPAVSRERKQAVLHAITARVHSDALVGRLLSVLLANHRLLHLDDVIRAIQERLDRDRNVVEAHLATSAPLAAPEAGRIRAALEGRSGRTVRLTSTVDPSLLGGFVVRIGSEVYDASLAKRLRRTRQALHEGAEGHHG